MNRARQAPAAAGPEDAPGRAAPGREVPAREAPAREVAAPDAEVQGDLRLWLRLLACCSSIERVVRRGLRREFETTLPRFDLMAQLYRAPEGLSMGELSQRMMVTNGNVTGLAERLVQEGLVRRSPAADDRRRQTLVLTEAGLAAFRRMTPVHAGWIEGMLAGLAPEEKRQLAALLGRLKQSVEAYENGAQP